jgi:tetratricopeptide (TPR) repeat protein
VVELHALDSARAYKLKTNDKGEFSSIAVILGQYNAVLLQSGQEIDHANGIAVGLNETRIDFDLHHETTSPRNLTPEQVRQLQEMQAKQQKDSGMLKVLNEKLATANQSIQNGDFDSAISTLTQATQMDADHDLLWARLGAAYLGSAPKQADNDEKSKRFAEAADAYQKAIDLKQKQSQPGKQTPQQTAQQAEELAGYYNNLAHAAAKSGKLDDAVKAYNQAAQINPAQAYLYYYNLGAILYNAGKVDEAIDAYDKSIAADPSRPDSYYQKGVVLVAKATTDKNGKVIPVAGTQEALNKYLQLAPNGQFVNEAKGLIQYLGGAVETSNGKKKD